MSSFFEELKRRKVYRVAVAYVIAAGGIIQLASAVFPAWELPNWALRLTVVLLLIGFPLVLVLAWAFDVTPQGIRTTPTLPLSPDAAVERGHRRRNIVLLVGSGVLASAIAGFFLLPKADATKMEKSIAVLPFENLSEDKDNAFFADGIQDDILTNLAKIGDLKVISRTSVMAYRNKPASVREIGKALGVSAILEGSVRKIDNRVRINVQLINAENDRHIWAEDYDRELTDVFAIQTDLAQKIAKELNAHLSPSEKEHMMRKPTDNDEAYFAFMEARSLHSSLEDLGKLKQAVQRYERALELDPKFVLAMANLSILHSWILHFFEPDPAEREAAKRYAEGALELQPNSPEAHLALGYYYYYGKLDYERALQEFAIAQNGLPNDSQVYLVIGAIQRRQGKWKESTFNLEKAVALNPNDTWPLQNLYFNYQMQRDFDAANRVIDRGLALDPKSFSFWSFKAQNAVVQRGDLSIAEKGLAKLKESVQSGAATAVRDPELLAKAAEARANVFLFQRKYHEVLEAVAELPNEKLTSKPHGYIGARLFEGIAREKLGQTTEARAAFTAAKSAAESALRDGPNEPSRHAVLADALAHLGEKEKAITEAKRAIELRPESADAFEGPDYTEALARVYALTGENAQAIALLDGLLSRPGNLTLWLLKLDPVWDGLRSDPAFQQLLAKYETRR